MLLENKVIAITGAGRGIGQAMAHLAAQEGAAVVVNDFGVNVDGTSPSDGPAAEVAEEITKAGGRAVANFGSVAEPDGARSIVEQAVAEFGQLDGIVNNAGILRDRMLVNLSEDEWDVVMRVNSKGHAAPLRHAAAYWRQRSKAGDEVSASVINTSSPSALFANVGQTNYGAAKMAIAGLTMIAAKELASYGVRVNTIAPAARTRLTGDGSGAPRDPDAFDRMDPANVAPWVVYLASDQCTMTGRTFVVYGGSVVLVEPWRAAATLETDGQWSLEELVERGPQLDLPFDNNNPFEY